MMRCLLTSVTLREEGLVEADESPYAFIFEIINGVKLGIEHISVEDDEDVHWMIALDLFIFRLGLMKYKE